METIDFDLRNSVEDVRGAPCQAAPTTKGI